MNVLFALWASYAVYECMVATSLNDFFLNGKSFLFSMDYYDIYSIVDAAKNLFVMGVTCVAALCRLCAVGSYARTIRNIAIVRQVRKLRADTTKTDAIRRPPPPSPPSPPPPKRTSTRPTRTCTSDPHPRERAPVVLPLLPAENDHDHVEADRALQR